MAENKYKIVYFNTYCYKCKHCLTKETSDPCNECLNNPINENSRRPINFEEEIMVTKGD